MRKNSLLLLLLASLTLAACGPGQPFGPTLTPTPTETSTPTATFTPEPTDTPLPPPTETPALPAMPPTPAVQAMIPIQGEPLLIEQFQDNGRGWTGLYPGSDVEVQIGNLFINGSQTGQAAGAYCSGICGPYQVSYYYQAQLVEETSSDAGFGLIFGLDPEQDTYYAFMIRPYTGDFSLLKRANQSWTTLLNWTAASAIQPFPQPNTLGVSFLSGNINLYVNGTLVGTYADKTPYISGRIGFYVEKDNVGVLASNVAVFFQEPPPATSTPLPRPTIAVTPTDTPQGACPPTLPNGTWALVIFKQSSGRERIEIDGAREILLHGQNAFYLKLNQMHTIVIKGKTYYYKYDKCQIIYLKIN
jgi:hypothetical protein